MSKLAKEQQRVDAETKKPCAGDGCKGYVYKKHQSWSSFDKRKYCSVSCYRRVGIKKNYAIEPRRYQAEFLPQERL